MVGLCRMGGERIGKEWNGSEKFTPFSGIVES